MRVPEYGWTTQKVFHFLNFLVNGVRSLVFAFRRDIQKLHPEVRHHNYLDVRLMSLSVHSFQFVTFYATFWKIVQHILLDMPSIAFFTTYALLVLFWDEIYYQVLVVQAFFALQFHDFQIHHLLQFVFHHPYKDATFIFVVLNKRSKFNFYLIIIFLCVG